MNFIHDVCTLVRWGVVSVGSFLCSVLEGSSRVALRVSREVLFWACFVYVWESSHEHVCGEDV